MSQNDLNIENQLFPQTRADINAALQALASNSSGASAPGTTYPYQIWADTTNNLLKMRNGSNNGWLTLAKFDIVNDLWQPRFDIMQVLSTAGLTVKSSDGATDILTVSDAGVLSAPELRENGVPLGQAAFKDTAASITGSSNVALDSAVQAHVAVAGAIMFGPNAKLRDKTGSRVAGTSYQNNTPYPIFVSVTGSTTSAGKVLSLSDDNATWVFSGYITTSADVHTAYALWLPGQYVRADPSTPIGFWSEFSEA